MDMEIAKLVPDGFVPYDNDLTSFTKGDVRIEFAQYGAGKDLCLRVYMVIDKVRHLCVNRMRIINKWEIQFVLDRLI